MVGDFNQSNSAEANGVKVANNTVNFVHVRDGLVESPQGLARVLRLIAPSWYERREADALSIRVESLISSVKRLQEEFPAMSERRALMEALGYRMTNEQADNTVEVFAEAQDILIQKNGGARGVFPEARDAVIEGAKVAYDNRIRSMWAKLIAGEASSPGTFSKKCMAILSEMNVEDALLFSKLCGFCITLDIKLDDEDLLNRFYDPILILSRDKDGSSYNEGAFPLLSLYNLEAFGLVTTSLSRTLNLPRGAEIPYRLGSKIALLSGAGNVEKLRTHVVLTQYGKELSKLCELGIDPKAPEVLQSFAAREGVTVRWLSQGC